MATTAARQRSFMPRDFRISANTTDRNYVRFGGPGTKSRLQAAQFSDISASGMRLISRQSSRAKVGDSIEVQFSLPGSKIELKTRALIVRKVNEFEFAVSFMDFTVSKKRLFQTAIDDYFRYLRATPFVKRMARLAAWGREHRQGLVIALLSVIVFAGIFTYIYRTSDEYNGRDLKSWGKEYPRQYDWDHYNKIPKR